MSLLRGVVFLLVLAGAIGFAIKNGQPLSLRYYFGWETVALPLFLWALLSFLLGLILSGVIASISKITLKSKIRRQKREISDLERNRIDRQREHPSSS